MFTFLAVSAIIVAAGAIPVVIASLFLKTSRNDLACERELLMIAVDAEKIRTSWRARHEALDRDV